MMAENSFHNRGNSGLYYAWRYHEREFSKSVASSAATAEYQVVLTF